jgi:Domain of unknown function (DUF1707)
MSEERPPRLPAPSMRASDEDRERLIAELNEHTVAGRLSTDDLEQRLQAAYSAQTTGELDALRLDLPVTARQAALEHKTRRAHLTRRMIQESGGSLALFVVCTAIWFASGGHHGRGSFWPVWVLIVFVMSVARNGWTLYGPAPDLDAVETHLNARRQQRLTERERRDRRRHRGRP